MANFSTKTCQKADHPEICFTLSDKSNLSADWLLNYFETEVSRGTRFRSGETVQIGWMITQLKDAANSSLEVWEPDFDSMPIKWCRGVNNTLRHLLLQKSVCHEVAAEPQFPSLMQAGIVSPAFLTTSMDFVMSRDVPKGNDSGWVFHEPGYAGSEGKFVSLYEIVLSRPEIVPYLGLPTEASVTSQKEVINLVFGDSRISSVNNDFLNKIAKVPSFV